MYRCPLLFEWVLPLIYSCEWNPAVTRIVDQVRIEWGWLLHDAENRRTIFTMANIIAALLSSLLPFAFGASSFATSSVASLAFSKHGNLSSL